MTAVSEDPASLQAATTAMQDRDTSPTSTTRVNVNTVEDDHSSQGSLLSHISEPVVLNSSTSDVSQPIHVQPIAGDITPPSSTTSSNDQLDRQLPHSFQSQRQPSTESLTDHTTSNLEKTPVSELVSGTKRTASGQIKKQFSAGIEQTRHSRTTSSVSNSSSNGNVMELSQQLRTKLTYAMLKVQNGWQARSLDEVESLASQSPRSTRSTIQDRSSILSPRSSMAHKSRRTWSDSDSSDSAQSGEPRSPTLVSSLQNGTSLQSIARRALAPPANIISGSRRRPAPNGLEVKNPQETTLQSQFSRPVSTQRTPSQNAAMEADAVETLLFMASPNNSGHHPPSSNSQESAIRTTQLPPVLTSPLRTQFSQTSVTSPKRVAFSDTPMLVQPPVVDKAALIDRILEALSDVSDDELESAFRLADRSQTAKLST